MPVEIVYFPQEAVELQREVKNHPILIAQLAALPDDADLESRVGVILAYCGIEADGYFYEEDLIVLFNLMLQRLRSMGALTLQ
jgi:hypothetical protein